MLTFNDKIIEVCSECGTAACWYGEFMCSDSRNAGTEKKTVRELRLTRLENQEYWTDNKMREIYGHIAPFGYDTPPPTTEEG